MPRAGLSAEAVVDAAAELADAEGMEAVTLAALAARLGVRPPSLYAHVGGLEDLRGRLAGRGLELLAADLQDAATGRAGREALVAVAGAYRSFAHAHPGLYAALQRAPGDSPVEADTVAAAERVLTVVLAVLQGYGLAGEAGLHAARVLRAALHGFVTLEAQGGFGMPISLDESFEQLVAVLDAGFTRI